MPPLSPVQLDVSVSHEGMLYVNFRGRSGPEDIPLFKATIDARLRADTKIRHALFDLSGIDPSTNAAGRLLDLACSYAGHSSELRITHVEVKIPRDIYGMLAEIEPKMPAPGKDQRAKWRGVNVYLVKELDYSGLGGGAFAAPEVEVDEDEEKEAEEETHVVLACEGKVRAINGSVVSVTLFTEEGQIEGEFDRKQFSKGDDITVDMPFEYQAYVTAPGRTIVMIDPLTQQYATDEELIDDVKKLGVNFHKF